MNISIRKISYTGIFCLPLLVYLGERSYISQDEGYYALQARWILDTGNWIAPMWWQEIVFDRTIGIQWLIALSQKLVGKSIFAAHLPSLISAIICLICTYYLSNEFVKKSYSWLSPLILLTTYLWINNAHLATQDMPLLAFELLGILSIVKAKNLEDSKYLFCSGISIGGGILMKSFMIIIPIIAISPYIIKNKRFIIYSKHFWIGLAIGLLPVLIWLSLILKKYGLMSIMTQISKLSYLSSSEAFRQPIYYYLWNIPINTFPWSITAFIGMIIILNSNRSEHKQILLYYPLIIIIILSLFNTKTPYYGLQVTPFISIITALFFQSVFNDSNHYRNLYKLSLGSIGFLILSLSLYMILNPEKYLTVSQNQIPNLYLITAFVLGISWFAVIFVNNYKLAIILIILGPYLSYLITVQAGILSDRSPEIRKIFNEPELTSIIDKKTIDFAIYDELENDEYSKLIKLALYSPSIGKRIKDIKSSKTKNLIWTNDLLKIGEEDSIKIIYSNKKLSPWILVKQN